MSTKKDKPGTSTDSSETPSTSSTKSSKTSKAKSTKTKAAKVQFKPSEIPMARFDSHTHELRFSSLINVNGKSYSNEEFAIKMSDIPEASTQAFIQMAKVIIAFTNGQKVDSVPTYKDGKEGKSMLAKLDERLAKLRVSGTSNEDVPGAKPEHADPQGSVSE